jgi:hypothetical protein
MAVDTTNAPVTLQEPAAPDSAADTVRGWEQALVLLYLAAAGLLMMYLIARLWPQIGPDGKWNSGVSVFWKRDPFSVSEDVRLLLLTVMSGALGSFIHAATSFVDFAGNRRLVRSWIPWYFMRPVIGSALAFVLYVAVRGGLLTAGAGSENVSPYGVVAIASLAGMFSKQATDKLNEMFTTMFKTTEGDAARKDKLDAAPKVISIEPAQLPSGVEAEVKVNGSGFDSAAIVRLNGQPKITTFVNATQLTVRLSATDLPGAGAFTLLVQNPSGQTSGPAMLTVV